MPTSATDPRPLLVHYAGGGTLAVADGRILPGDDAALAEGPAPAVRTVLVVPGEQVAIHWLELADTLAPAQAAAAARLMLADASAEPLADMHVAVGRAEAGLTPVALVPAARMAEWVASDPDLIIPSSLLLAPPAEGLVRHGLDHRGQGQAFSAEPELAALIAGEAPVAELDDAAFEAGLPIALAEPVLNLRQGAFARRRQFRVDSGAARRIAFFIAALLIVTLVLQIATIMRYSFDADRMEREAAALGPGARPRANFDLLAPILFEAVRATPNLQLTRLEYRPDGSLGATVQVDSPATLAAFRARAEAAGAAMEGGSLQSAGGQQSAEIVLRPA